MSRKLLIICAAATVLLYQQTVARGIVLHPGGEPNLAVWTDRPKDEVLGSWYIPDTANPGEFIFKASCVAVSSNAVVTTHHQGGGVGSRVWLADVEYTVEHIINEPNSVDLRLCRVKRTSPGATYLQYVSLYTLDNGDEKNKEIVIGGFGDTTGNPVSDGNDGYYWTDSDETHRWGTNKILNQNQDWEGVVNIRNSNDIIIYTSDVIISEFDPCETTAYEAIANISC